MNRQEGFSFGKRWKSYIKDIDRERVEAAQNSLQRHFDVEDLRGSRVIDVGCGSGLFSLAALQLGAKEIIGFDYDTGATQAARQLRRDADEPNQWRILQGDMLDNEFIRDLPEADYVYAWGSVHYTGSLWEALDNALSLVAPGGVIFVTIWNRVLSRELSTGKLKSSDWELIKRFYNQAPDSVQMSMIKLYYVLWMLLQYKRGGSPAQKKRQKKKTRGMSVKNDIRMWLGGLPYDYATVGEVCEFVLQHDGFIAEFVDENDRFGNNLYRFRREQG